MQPSRTASTTSPAGCSRGGSWPLAVGGLGAAAALAILALVACGGGATPDHDGGSSDGDPGDGDAPARDAGPDADPALPSLERLETPADFIRLAGEEWAVKYLGVVPGQNVPAGLNHPCVFQNTATYPLHLAFLKTFAEYRDLDFQTYLALTQKNAARRLWAGELKLLAGATHPRTGGRGVMAYFVYADLGDPLSVDQLVEVDQRLKSCVPYARDLLVLVGEGDQELSFAANAAALKARGVDFALRSQLAPDVGAESYSLGKAYGFLRVVPAGQSVQVVIDEAGPRDIVIAESATDELGLVAGLITTLPQNIHSHLNLRLREKKIPNARIGGILGDQAIVNLDGRLAYLEVTDNQARLEPALLADAEAFWASHRPTPRPLTGNLDETRVRPFATMSAADKDAYGAKAANLAELHQLLPAANRAEGFGIPFALSHKFMTDSGLDAQVEALLADPLVKTDARTRRTKLAALRKAIEAAPVPLDLIMGLVPTAQAAFGAGYATLPSKFRSSSNVEDGELSSGAGLYDSARGCFADDFDGDLVGPSACLSAAESTLLSTRLEQRRAEFAAHPDRTWLLAMIDDLSGDLTKERSVARALKKVWASLWNDRAFEERAYYGSDHRMALMGLAVDASFVNERLDAVAVTNLADPTDATLPPIYRVVSQKDGLPVVRPPDPTVVAETLTFRRGPGDAVLDPKLVVMSSLAQGPLWTDPQRTTLAGLLYQVQDHFAAKVYPQITNPRFDLEIKLTSDERVVIKQVRPYINVDP
jgi:pyruvate,water dikinase